MHRQPVYDLVCSKARHELITREKDPKVILKSNLKKDQKYTDVNPIIQSWFRYRFNNKKRFTREQINLKRDDWFEYRYVAILGKRKREIYFRHNRTMDIDAFNSIIDLLLRDYPNIEENEVIKLYKVDQLELIQLGKIIKRTAEINPDLEEYIYRLMDKLTVVYRMVTIDRVRLEE